MGRREEGSYNIYIGFLTKSIINEHFKSCTCVNSEEGGARGAEVLITPVMDKLTHRSLVFRYLGRGRGGNCLFVFVFGIYVYQSLKNTRVSILAYLKLSDLGQKLLKVLPRCDIVC